MNDFISKYQDELTGSLSGFDRLVFRGNLWRDRLSGMKGYLWAHHLGGKDFGAHADYRLPRACFERLLCTRKPNTGCIQY